MRIIRSRPGIPVVPTITAATLAGIGVLHVGWGLGASFPFRDRAALADTLVGGELVPGSRASFAVAGLLGVAACLVADAVPLPSPLRRLGVVGVAAVLATRAAFGFTGSTERLVPGSNSPRFVEVDRRVYSPLCSALAIGALASARR